MNRKNLTAAVLAGLAGAAGIAGTAQAVNLNPDGLGQVLIYPYYTTNDGNTTLLSVVNTTDQAKAVKVRFKEGYNSREVLDFNLYMSAYDVWVAAIGDGADLGFPSQAGVPHLVIPDTSCTVPYLYGNGIDDGLDFGLQAFLPFDYSGVNNDGGPDETVGGPLPRAAEGYFEMIEMGTLINEDTETAKRIGSAQAATHVLDDDGKAVPEDCQQLVDNWSIINGVSGQWLKDRTLDIRRNSGGLFGGAAIINVGRGTMYSYDARAIQGYDESDGGVHRQPGFSDPSLNDGDQTDAWVFFGTPQNRAVNFFYPRGVDAISAVFMHEFTMNEFNIDPIVQAGSEWILTFPTKSWYTDPVTFGGPGQVAVWVPNQNDPDCDFWSPGDDFPTRSGPDPESDDGFGGSFDLCSYIQGEVNGNEPIPPFTSLFDGKACESFGFEQWDREESASTPGTINIPPVVSPQPPGSTPGEPDPFEMCYEVNVMRFGSESIFGTTSDLLLTVSDTADTGWARINWGANPDHLDYAGLVGLPVTGFWAEQFSNGFLGTPEASVLANYGGLFNHKGNVRRTRPSDCVTIFGGCD